MVDSSKIPVNRIDELDNLLSTINNNITSIVDNVSSNYIKPDFHSYNTPFMEFNSKTQLIIHKNTIIRLEEDGENLYFKLDEDKILTVTDILDSGSSLTAGSDYYIYLYNNLGQPGFICSKNSTYPTGKTATNTRKIGGFHTLCADVGAISGHPLSGYTAGNILPASVWCLNRRPHCSPEGMVYIEPLNFWCDIYLQSGTSTNTKSVFGGTVTDSRNPPLHYEDLMYVKKQPLGDTEFQCAAEGSNQQTSILGSAAPNPKTSGGHVDTANRRMISNFGCEEMCGYLWQWLESPSASGGSGWTQLQDTSKGAYYGECFVLCAGGVWDIGSDCGSRTRNGAIGRSYVNVYFGCRGKSSNINQA